MTIYLNELTEVEAIQKLKNFILRSKCKELTMSSKAAQLIVAAKEFKEIKERNNQKIGELGDVEIRLDDQQSILDGRIFEKERLIANVIDQVDI